MEARDEHHNPSEDGDKQITNNIRMESSHQQNVMKGSVIQVNHHSNPASEHQQEETGDEK
jgi:rRNA maturation protein Rpf1